MPDYILRTGLLLFKGSLWENALEAKWNQALMAFKMSKLKRCV
jgi:hypothetical protein